MNKNVKLAKELIKIAKSLIAQEDFISQFPKLMKDLGFTKKGETFVQNFQIDHYNDVDVFISEPSKSGDKYTCTLSEKTSMGGHESYESITFTPDKFAVELENGAKELKAFGKIYKSINYNKIKNLDFLENAGY